MNKPTLMCLDTEQACERVAHCVAAGRCGLLEEKSKLPEEVQAAFETEDPETTQRTRVPTEAAATMEDAIAMVESLSSADRAKLLKALRALYGDP